MPSVIVKDNKSITEYQHVNMEEAQNDFVNKLKEKYSSNSNVSIYLIYDEEHRKEWWNKHGK